MADLNEKLEDPVVVEDADGLVLAIRHDRTIEFGEGITPEDAARRFCEAIVEWLDARYAGAVFSR